MGLLAKFKQNASDTTKAIVVAAALTIAGTGLITAWSAAITPKDDHAAYVSQVQSDALGAGIGFSTSLSILTGVGLMGMRKQRKP